MTLAETMIQTARQRRLAGVGLRKKDLLLLELSDYEPHMAWELARSVSHRFGAYVSDLRKDGLEIETERRTEIAPSAFSYVLRRGSDGE